jgi:hypothetical protein
MSGSLDWHRNLLRAGESLHAGSTNVVIQWNNAVLQAIRNVNPGPAIAARALAITHTCIYDAWTPYDANAVPTQPTGIAKRSFAVSFETSCAVSAPLPMRLYMASEYSVGEFREG